MKHDNIWLLTAAAINFLAIGIPYWLIPYNRLNLPDALIGPGLLLIIITAAVVRFAGRATLRQATCWMGASVVAVVISRILVDCIQNPTSHNLWPFEVIIALMLGFPSAFAGALAGSAAALLRQQLALRNA